MALNYIWVGFFLIALVVGLVKLIFLGDTHIFTAMVASTFDTAKVAFEISLGLTGVLSLWLGLMKVGEAGGAINVLAKVVRRSSRASSRASRPTIRPTAPSS